MSSDRPTQYSSNDKKRHITLTMDNGGHGSLLTEVVRANLHGSNPSVVIKNLLKGVRHFKTEVEDHAEPTDKMLLDEMEKELIQLFGKLSKRETELYDTTDPASMPMVEPAMARPLTPGGSFQPASYQKATVRDVRRPKVGG